MISHHFCLRQGNKIVHLDIRFGHSEEVICTQNEEISIRLIQFQNSPLRNQHSIKQQKKTQHQGSHS